MNVLDGTGVHGLLVHYGMIIAMVGSAFLLFFYFWWNGKLDMDEEPKHAMLSTEDGGSDE